MDVYEKVVRPLLFRLSADRAHDLGHLGLRAAWPWRLAARSSRFADLRLATELAGIRLGNPFGLAPGFDKDGRLVASLDQLGFGYLVIGSITREPRPGNPKPRLVRYPQRRSISNSMGLPSVGLAKAVDLLRTARVEHSALMASVAGFTPDELLEGAAAVQPHVAALEIGLICPNTTESERLEEISLFTRLAEGLTRDKSTPVFIKLPPHFTEVERTQVFRMLDVIMRTGVDGVSLSGGRSVDEPALGMGRGSLNGRDTFEDALRIVADVYEYTGGAVAIKGSGGVFDGDDAVRMFKAGASTVEVYTSFIYRGWGIAGMLKRELLAALEREGLDDVRGLLPTLPGR